MLKTYVIDIDGTICINGDCSSCKYEGSIPIPERIKQINTLYDEGHTIKYFTARGMGRFNDDVKKAQEKFYTLTKTQLSIWGCKYHELILGKPSGDIYIDDKGVNVSDFFN